MRTTVGKIIQISCEICNKNRDAYVNWPPTDENMPICCGKPMTYHASRQTRTAYVKGDYMRKGKERLDGGIPFGEVPGDRDYTQIEGDGHMRKSDFLEKTKGKDMGPLP